MKTETLTNKKVAILGAGNIGLSIAQGIVRSGACDAHQIYLTRRKVEKLNPEKEQGFHIGSDNIEAIKNAEIIIIAVEPSQVDPLLKQIAPSVRSDIHTLISVATGVTLSHMKAHLGDSVKIVRSMPNTAIAINESMTCLACCREDHGAMKTAVSIFSTLGEIIEIDEELMSAATALGACGVAFFLRAIRAASQGGIEIGFSSEDAIKIASQAAKGAASLLLQNKNHPEFEVDKVATPRGCTIAGLNSMEHAGFSSAMIDGITKSAEKASVLFNVKINTTNPMT